jgi:alpha-tubulin suppressor-like RCC1 family protein
MVAARRHVEAAKKGATMLVPLGEGREEGRITWAAELRWVFMALARLRVGGAKKLISAGNWHTLVTSGTETWSFGCGSFGMLGHGGEENEAVPRPIEALNRVAAKQVAAGIFHSVLISDGDVWTWGHGNWGQLGHGNTDQQNVPKRVGGLTNVTDIAAGRGHSLAVEEGGAVYMWGSNSRGQLGLGDHGSDTDRHVPTLVDGVNGVVAVAAGQYHSFALSRDGTFMACGSNGVGNLGLGDTDDRDTFTVVPGLSGVVDIDAGDRHTIAVTCEGEVWTWGKGWATGHNDEDTAYLVSTKVTGGGIEEAIVVQVAAGNDHSMALTSTGEFYSWGEGNYGQLGHGDKEKLAVPRVVGGIGGVVGMSSGIGHSLAITGEGRVLAFGDTGSGVLGLGAVREALVPTAIDGITMGEGDEGKEGKE